MRKITLFALLLALSGVYFLYPFWTLQRMQDAIKARDVDTLETMIDWPRLRDGLRTDIQAMLTQQAFGEKSGIGTLGTMLGSAMVGPMIDAWASPSGLRKAFAETPGENAKMPVLDRTRFITLTAVRADMHAVDDKSVAFSLDLEFGSGVWRLTRIGLPLEAFQKAMANKPKM